MGSPLPQSLLVGGGVPFALKDGRRDIITPTARRTYDHIINSRIGSFPLNGLTDEQVRNILSASRLAPNEIEAIWQLTETIDAKGLPDGSWTQLEIYIILHYAQASEALSLETMAMQYAGSIPPKPAEEIRRRSSYAEEGLRLRASLNHDPMPSSPSPALTTILRHSTSNATTLSMVRDPLFTHRIQDTGDALLSQPGLEALGPIEEGATYRLGSSRRPLRESSIRTSTTDGAQKLHDLIQSKCPDVHIEPDIQTLQPRSFQSSSLDDAVARDILIRKKVEIGDFKESSKQLSNILKSKKGRQKAADNANSTFNQTELSAALRETVDGSGEVGVAKALIDMGAQINSYKETSKSKWRGSRTESIPINYVKIAASHNNEDMVSLLASSGASSSNLVEALEQSVRQNRPNIVLALLQQGVNWMTRSESIFASAIASKNPTLVRPLLRWPLKNRKNLVSSNLPTAVDYGQYEVVSLLMKYGADPRSQNALAMKKAVQAQRVDIVLAMMKDIEGSARSTIASSIFMEAFSSRSSQNAREQYEQYVMLESLLYYGARGDPVACMLVQVVRAGRQSIARLLVKYGADVQYHDAEALRVAIATENSKMLSILLVAKVTQRTASGIVDEIPGTSSDDESSWMLSLLIAKGAAGPPLTKVLVRAVEHKWYKTMGLLLDHRADVEFEGSQPLRMAVTGGDEQSLNLLLSKGRPKTETMQLLLPLIPQDPPRLRFVMTKAIINAAGQDGIAASVLSDALVEILSHPSREVHQYLVPLADVLITAGARVDHKRGKCFQLAAEIGSTELLDLLNQHVSKVGSLSPAMSTCMKTRDPEKRKALVGILLKGGAKGSEVDQALIDAIDEELIDKALVHHLLEKADLNYLGGRALSTALQRRPCDLTAAIIETGRTTKKVRSDALKSLFEPDVKERRTKLCLLLQAGVEQDALDNALVQEIEGKRDSQIVKNLLSHGASCNYKNGKALDLAIHLQDVHSLEQLIQSHPSRLVLEAMISKAMSVERTNSRRACLSLLFREGAKGERASFALIQEVETSGYRDPQTLQLLVNSGATIDYLEGRALRFAVSYPLDITVVRILVSGIGASTVISSLLPLALKHRSSVRVPLLQILLEKGASGNDINESLVTAVSEGAHAQSTIDLLLKHKASVNSDGARAVKKAAELKACSVLESLLRNYNRKHIDEIIGLAMQLPSSPSQEQRLDRLRCVRLLTPPTVTNPELVNSPLIQAVKERDRELIEYLISAGANANSNAGRSVVIAAEQRDFGSLQVLMRSKIKPTSQTCSSAFSVLPHTHDRWQTIPETVQKFDGILISEGAVGLAVDQTFLNALRSPHAFAADFIHLALRSKTLLNPNHDAGAALCIASKEARLAVVDYLLACRPSEPTLQAAFMSVFESPVEERTLIKLARMFFAHSQSASHVDFRRSEILESALYEALRRHSDKPDFIQELLNNGCKAEYSWSGKYNGSNIAEQMSTLLWLLCEGGQEVDVRIVDSLLEAGANPKFRTEASCLTPLIVAATLPHAEILLSLLKAGAEPDTEDNAGRTPLQYATMAGDIECMSYLLRYKADTRDESLHIAARNLNFSAVNLLLDHGAPADMPGTQHCDGRTPLAELCRAANLLPNPPQLKKTLTVLCETGIDLERTTQGKTLVFHALDNKSPLKMATALLVASRPIRNALKDSIFHKNSVYYSPTAYVRHFRCEECYTNRSLDLLRRCCTLSPCCAPKLEDLLRSYGCKDRFWDANAGANQPKGWSNPPAIIRNVIQDAEDERRERDLKNRAQREKDAAAAAERKRERERLQVLNEEREAERRDLQERLDAENRARERRAAIEMTAIRRQTEAENDRVEAQRRNEQRADDDRRDRTRRDFQEEMSRTRQMDEERGRVMRELSNIQVDQRKREENLRRETIKEERAALKERTGMIDSAKSMFREAGYSGVSRVGMGKVLGEIDEA